MRTQLLKVQLLSQSVRLQRMRLFPALLRLLRNLGSKRPKQFRSLNSQLPNLFGVDPPELVRRLAGLALLPQSVGRGEASL